MSILRKSWRERAATGTVVAVLAFGATDGLAGESQVVEAFAVVEVAGNLLATGSDSTRLMGSLEGPFFIDAGHGPVDAGNLRCVANMQGAIAGGRQTGEGSCVMTAHDGASLYSDWTCEGVRFVGCRGDFVITGGSGRLEGVGGGGHMTWRASDVAIDARSTTGLTATSSRGIVFWDEFVFEMPEQ